MFLINAILLNVHFILYYHLCFRKEIYFFECLYFSECDIRISLYAFWYTLYFSMIPYIEKILWSVAQEIRYNLFFQFYLINYFNELEAHFLKKLAFVTNKCFAQDAFGKFPGITVNLSKYIAVRE